MKLKQWMALGCAVLTFMMPFSARADEEDLTDLNVPMEAESVAAATAADLQITSASAVLVEQSTGKVIYEKDAHEQRKPASVTKVMSLLLIMEALDRGDFSLETEVKTSPYAASMGGSQIWLKENETMTVNELLKATAIASANDATVALAETVAGSEEAFVGRMNERAEQLGMKDTHFENATGLDANGHVTSAYDIALMSRELLKHPLITSYTTVWMDTLRDGKSELVNTNKLVRFYEGTTGLKTGTTSGAGFCLSASATRGGISFVAVIMDAPSSKVRFNEARSLLSYGFANYCLVKPTLPEEALAPLAVSGGTESTVGVRMDGQAAFVVERSKKDAVTVTFERAETVKAPVRTGDEVGIARITVDGEEIGSVPLLAEKGVDKMTFWVAVLRLLCQMAAV